MADAIAEQPPKLVIVAYGMNGAGFVDGSEFAATIQALMDTVSRATPTAEFILVSPMLPHPDWHYTHRERFADYRARLAGLCSPQVALADLTTFWEDVLERKSIYDLTGNGVNYPNDFGHRLYAQTILALLVDEAVVSRRAR